jgi:hypothetical protein
VGVRIAEVTSSGGGEKNVGYCARIKKCASRDCWELGLTMSGRETLPNPDTHGFFRFEGTTLMDEDRAMLRRENIRFDERLKKLKDPGDALKRKA